MLPLIQLLWCLCAAHDATNDIKTSLMSIFNLNPFFIKIKMEG